MKIIACGDIALCRGVESMILEGNEAELAQDLRKVLHEADVFLANVECPLTDAEIPAWNHLLALKGQRKVGRVLADLGISVASLANNHIADYGLKGLEDTISVLQDQGIPWVGAGWSPDEASRPLIIEKNNHRIGILALAQPEISAAKHGKWGAGVLEDNAVIEKVKALSEQVDIAIVYLHFGVEFSEYPTPHQVHLSRSLIDAGARLVIGHHPHVPQGYEYYKDGFIAYSLGNFIFDMPPGPHKFSRLGLLVQAEVDNGTISAVEIIPVNTQGGNPTLLKEHERKKAEAYLDRLSSVLKNENELKRAYYFICRDNFHVNIKALANYGIRKMNTQWVRDWLFAQLWPQLLILRIDLLRFLLSGAALGFEKRKGPPSEGLMAHFWRGICALFWFFGFGWGRHLRVK